ncbi:MAG: hypothetical protein WBY96_17320, partial [Candidatus Sulfotelmatobacter sp.]
PAAQIGNASYAKLDINLTPRNQLALRYNSSRYWGSNNVFLDPTTQMVSADPALPISATAS